MLKYKYTKCKNCKKKFKHLSRINRVFCSLSCITTYKNLHNNPMNNKKTIEKMRCKKLGCKVWNKGLTKYEHASIMKHSKNITGKNNPMKNQKIREKSIANIKNFYKNETKNQKEMRIEKIGQGWLKNKKGRKIASKRMKKLMLSSKAWFKDTKKRKTSNLISAKKRKIWLKTHKKEVRMQIKQRILYFQEHPEKQTYRVVSGKHSFWQKRLYLLLSKIINRHELKEEYFIRTERSWRYADVAWVGKKIDFEYDGEHFHDGRHDRKRDRELNEKGWSVIRFCFNDFKTGIFEKKLLNFLFRKGIIE